MSLYPLSRPCPKCGAKPQEFCRNTPAEPCAERWESPMTEIDTDKLVERLRTAQMSNGRAMSSGEMLAMMQVAGTAILAMAEENKRLREALERIALSGSSAETYRRIARRALGKDKA